MSDPFQEPMSDQNEQAPVDVGERSVPEVLADINAQLHFSGAILRDVQRQLDRIETVVTGSPQAQPDPSMGQAQGFRPQQQR